MYIDIDIDTYIYIYTCMCVYIHATPTRRPRGLRLLQQLPVARAQCPALLRFPPGNYVWPYIDI